MLAITTVYVPATNTRNARIVASTCNGHKVSQPVDYALGDIERHFAVAQALVRTQLNHAPNPETMVYGGTVKGYVFCFPASTITL
jgi:hypothetical protein